MGLTDHAQIVEDLTEGRTRIPRITAAGDAIDVFDANDILLETISGNPLTAPRRNEQTVTAAGVITIDPVATGYEQVVRVAGQFNIAGIALASVPPSGTILVLIDAVGPNATPIIVTLSGMIDQHTGFQPAPLAIEQGETRSVVLFSPDWAEPAGTRKVYAATGTGSGGGPGVDTAIPTGRIGWRAGRRASTIAELPLFTFASIDWSGGSWTGGVTLPGRVYRKNNAGSFAGQLFDATATIIRAGDSGPAINSTYNQQTATWTGANLGWLGATNTPDPRTNNQAGLWEGPAGALDADVDNRQNAQLAATFWPTGTMWGFVVEYAIFRAGTNTPLAINAYQTVSGIQDNPTTPGTARQSIVAFDSNVEMILWPNSGRRTGRRSIPWIDTQLFPEIWGVSFAGTAAADSTDPWRNQVTGVLLEKATWRVCYVTAATSPDGQKNTRTLSTSTATITGTTVALERLGPSASTTPDVYQEFATASGSAWVDVRSGAVSAPVINPGLPYTARQRYIEILTGDGVRTEWTVTHAMDLPQPFAPVDIAVVTPTGGLHTSHTITALTANSFTITITPAPALDAAWTVAVTG